MKKQLLYAENINKAGSSGIVELNPNGMKIFCICNQDIATEILDSMMFQRQYTKNEIEKHLDKIKAELSYRNQLYTPIENIINSIPIELT